MNKVNLQDLINEVAKYDISSIKMIIKAYNFAAEKHHNQTRRSGEPYIIHPLNVAYILSTLRADCNTIMAGLLHDTREDTKTTYEELEIEFNKEVANLVEGVTRISKSNFSNKEEEIQANTRKILTSIHDDVRIILIKLADRLHNMRTLEFNKKEKQIENAQETLDIYVPLANLLGTYNIKEELEDLSFYYTDEYNYKRIDEERKNLIAKSSERLFEMQQILISNLKEEGIDNSVSLYVKNIYGIYKRLKKYSNLLEIHDMVALKILVQEVIDCYKALYVANSSFNTVNSLFKDYICNPKINRYQALHTTLFTGEDYLVQARIRTYDMEKVALNGIATYWQQNGENARIKMQEAIKEKYQFFTTLEDINTTSRSNSRFYRDVKKDVLATQIYVFDVTGKLISMPEGSTVTDFAYKLLDKDAYYMVNAMVNSKFVPLDYVLKSNDIIRIIINKEANIQDHTSYVKTHYAKNLILQR